MRLFSKKTSKLDTLIKALSEFKKDTNCSFVKVYFFDKDNYTIKEIDENCKLIKSHRKVLDKSTRAFDLRKEK